MMYRIVTCCLGILLLLLSGCQHDPILEIVEEEDIEEVPADVSLLFLSHCRMESNTEYNADFYTVDFSKYQIRLLGGDLAKNSSADVSVMDTLHVFFDLDHANTLWALGNHDYDDLQVVADYTNRPAFYAHHFQGITFLVLDTQEDWSNFSGAQLELITQVTDTIEHSGALILLQHKLTWLYDNPVMASEVTPNGGEGSCFHCINPNNFYADVYPRLVEVEERGIQVYCLAGDLGFHDKTYHHLDSAGIDFLACGMNLDAPDNVALVLNFDGAARQLSWQEVPVAEL